MNQQNQRGGLTDSPGRTVPRGKTFVQNFFAYGFLQVLGKMVPFFMLPVLTRLLPGSEVFAWVDLFQMILGVGTPLALLGMTDAVYREYFAEEVRPMDVTTTAQRMVLVASTVVVLVLAIFHNMIGRYLMPSGGFDGVVLLSALGIWLVANGSLAKAPTRIENKTRIFLASGLGESVGYYGLVLLLVMQGQAIHGMMMAKVLISLVAFVAFFLGNRRYFAGRVDRGKAVALLKMGIPTLPTLLIYWLYHSMDRIFILKLLGAGELGIYAVGARMAQISLLIYGAFAGGWQYFAYSAMKDPDYKSMMGRVWEMLFILSSAFHLVVVLGKDWLFAFLFEGDYLRGAEAFSYLLMAPLLLMLFQVLSTQLNVARKTYLTPIILTVGAVVNLVLNRLLIPMWGIDGAAVATLLGYGVSLVVALIVVGGVLQAIELPKKVLGFFAMYAVVFLLVSLPGTGGLGIVGVGVYLALCLKGYGKTMMSRVSALLGKEDRG